MHIATIGRHPRDDSWTFRADIILTLGGTVAPFTGSAYNSTLPCVPKISPPDNTCVYLLKRLKFLQPRFFVFPHICLFLTYECGVVLHLFEINYVCFNFFALGLDGRVCCLLEIQAAIKLLHALGDRETTVGKSPEFELRNNANV